MSGRWHGPERRRVEAEWEVEVEWEVSIVSTHQLQQFVAANATLTNLRGECDVVPELTLHAEHKIVHLGHEGDREWC